MIIYIIIIINQYYRYNNQSFNKLYIWDNKPRLSFRHWRSYSGDPNIGIACKQESRNHRFMLRIELKSFSGSTMEEAYEQAVEFIISQKLDLLDGSAGIAQVRFPTEKLPAGISIFYMPNILEF